MSSRRFIIPSVLLTLVYAGTAYAGPPSNPSCAVGKYTGNSVVLMDSNRNGGWNGPVTDILHGIAQVFNRGVPIVGDFNNDGTEEVGKFDASITGFFVDVNGNQIWEGSAVDLQTTFAAFANLQGTSIPLVGDWDMDGDDDIGLYSVENDQFLLDLNDNGSYNGAATDTFAFINTGAGPGTPIVGDWNGDGQTDLGKVVGTTYYLDTNGNRIWEPGTDLTSTFAAFATPFTPIVGNFNGTAGDEIGKYSPGTGTNDTFILDLDGNGFFAVATDRIIGLAGAFGPGIPFVCDFNGDGTDDVGKYTDGAGANDVVYLYDSNGNGAWDGIATDTGSTFFRAAPDNVSAPLVGVWP